MSLIPLAIALLYLADRFEWHTMALFGVIATYGTCISRGSSDAPLVSTQTLFFAYWVLFEAFDLLRMYHRRSGSGLEWIFPLNAIGFISLSYFAWNAKAPADLWQIAAFAALMYLVSGILRAVVRPPSSFTENESLAQRLAEGSYEGAIAVAAVLAGLAIVGRVRASGSAPGSRSKPRSSTSRASS